MNELICVLIVDDHAIVREGLRLIFETIDDIEVVGENNVWGMHMAGTVKVQLPQ